MPKNSKLPKDVIEHWPEILKDVDIEVIPVEYLDSINVYFLDGKVWQIDVAKSRKKQDVDIETALEDLFTTYEDLIENIDFRLNTKQIKEDIQNRTRLFMKKRK